MFEKKFFRPFKMTLEIKLLSESRSVKIFKDKI
jgi:hypothetical protein